LKTVNLKSLIIAFLMLLSIPSTTAQSCKVCACEKKSPDCILMCADSGKDMPADCVKACAANDNGMMCMRQHAPSDDTVSIEWTHRYEEINDSYFEGKLPADVVVHLSNIQNDMGRTTPVGKSYRIDLSPRWNPTEKELSITLFHEVCHIAVKWDVELDAHGPKWQACMHRLSALGAFEDSW
jgi:SprT-like family